MKKITSPPSRRLSNLRLEICYRPIEQLLLNEKNPRIHTPGQVRQIARSIDQFGFLVPIIIDQGLNVICGHGRVLAAGKLGLQEVPTTRLDHLSPSELKALTVADNQLTLNGKWDDQLLGELLLDLSQLDLDFSLDITGFSVGEIDLRISALSDPKDDRIDDLPKSLTQELTTRHGDLWCLGRHRLLCGDALKAEDYATLMSGNLADMSFSDAPYNVKIDGHVSGLGATKHREFPMATGEMSQAEFTGFLRQAFEQMAAHSRLGSIHFTCMDWRHLKELLDAGNAVYSELKNLCVWAKDNGGMGSLYRSQHELVAVFKHGTVPHINNVELGRHGRNRTNVWNYPSANTFSKQTDEGKLNAAHPTPKPVKLVADAILDVSSHGDIVLDPFLGSGTTLMAAERTGRACYGLELDPLYVDLIVQRWQAYTGSKAKHAESGDDFDFLTWERNHGF